ncbi:MAG TPA: CAAX prenyl protease-related protein [Gemmatimonadales bacterium]|nr:CAAX prenyl protease-related protein [Gemmatimonadales bacterium]
MTKLLERFPSLPYVAPFALFMVLLTIASQVPFDLRVYSILRIAVLGLVLWVCSRGVIPRSAPDWLMSALVGGAVFLLWVFPDLAFPAYRDHWLFSNGLTGKVEDAIPLAGQRDPLVLLLRTLRAVILVPIVEELFWRGWLPRWIANPDDFRKVPVGSFTAFTFVVTAILFASEHGAMWDVGLAAGLVYNWWMQRTRSLGNLILSHAVTNACLSAYVILTGRWQYW